MSDTCALCGSSDDLKLCFVRYVAGSVGFIRPCCAKCRTGNATDSLAQGSPDGEPPQAIPESFVDTSMPSGRVDFISPRRTMPDGSLEPESEWGKRCAILYNVGKPPEVKP